MNQGLVSVICLCYNHERFVTEALHSLTSQTYKNIEIIVVDDASSDGSAEIIQKFATEFPNVRFLALKENVGNCKAFNAGFALSRGEYVIDFSADDVLSPHRIEKGTEIFQRFGALYGIQFSDAEIIADNGDHLYNHSDKFPHDTIPQGDVYKQLIKRYFICSPSMMMRREVLEELNGYDESLSFEDFDLWIRSSRKFLYCYLSEILVKKRLTTNAMSAKQFTRGNSQRWSTLKVCEKIKQLNRNTEEDEALRHRLRYECILSLRMLDVRLAMEFFKLWWRV